MTLKLDLFSSYYLEQFLCLLWYQSADWLQVQIYLKRHYPNVKFLKRSKAFWANLDLKSILFYGMTLKLDLFSRYHLEQFLCPLWYQSADRLQVQICQKRHYPNVKCLKLSKAVQAFWKHKRLWHLFQVVLHLLHLYYLLCLVLIRYKKWWRMKTSKTNLFQVHIKRKLEKRADLDNKFDI